MKKKLYTLGAVMMAAAMTVSAQTVIDSDVTFDCPFDEGDYAGESAVTITNATVTMGAEALNTCGFPFMNDGEIVILSDGGKVKFFDSPETEYPNPDEAGDWASYMYNADGTAVTALPFNWVIEGEGNEIYLDSYSTFGGTMTGSGTVTIYCGNQNKLAFNTYYASEAVSANPQFTGTMIFKTLDGYTCDTLKFTNAFPGTSTDGVSYSKASGQWASIPFTMDVNGLNNPVLYSTSNDQAWPAIAGECTIYTTRMAHFRNATAHYYDAVVEGGNGDGYHFEMYPAGTIAFNKPVNSLNGYAYHRQGQLLLFNSPEPSFSNIVNSISARHKEGTYGGDGFVDARVEGKDGNTVNVCPGHSGPNDIGTLKVRELYLYRNNGVSFDFDGQTSDKIAIKDSAVFAGTNTRVWLNLMPDFFTNTKEGNYLVLDGKCVIDMQPVNDTVGYYVVDSVLTYAKLNTETGDYTDTITYYSNIKKYGAYKDNNGGNRELDTLMYWGPGTGGYGTTEEYVPSPNKIDAATWQVEYSTKLRDSLNAIVYVPGTQDSVKYTGHTFTASDIALHHAYDYVYNFNLDVKNSAMTLPNPYIPGDSVAISSDFFHFTFENTDSITGEVSYRYHTKAVTVYKNAEHTDSINYWFDFTYFFTDGVIQLLSDAKSSVSLDETPVNGAYNHEGGFTAIEKLNDIHSVAGRQIFTIDGKRVSKAGKGLNIVTTRFDDGTVETRKLFIAE